jgi:hypothetical protein
VAIRFEIDHSKKVCTYAHVRSAKSEADCREAVMVEAETRINRLMPNIKWTYEKLLEEARRYETKQEFRNKSSSAYAAAKYRKIIDDVCAHMSPPRTSWTDEMLAAEAKKYATKTDFKNGSC